MEGRGAEGSFVNDEKFDNMPNNPGQSSTTSSTNESGTNESRIEAVHPIEMSNTGSNCEDLSPSERRRMNEAGIDVDKVVINISDLEQPLSAAHSPSTAQTQTTKTTQASSTSRETRKISNTRDHIRTSAINDTRKKDTRTIKGHKSYNMDLPEAKRDEDEGKCLSRLWWALSILCTIIIPNPLIKRKGSEAKQAWREKITFFMIFMILNAIFLIVFGVIPLYFCREATDFDKIKWYNEMRSPTCYGLNVVMYGILFLVAGLLVIQCLCSLALVVRSFIYRCKNIQQFKKRDLDEAVMVMVPCYNEGDAELRKTIDSIMNTKYPSENKVMLVVADGIITGKGEFVNTPKYLAKILGFEVHKKDKGYVYPSIGSSQDNRASVYHGVCEREGKSLKYIVIVKRGTPEEKDSVKPGNRGKRDSQLIALGLFNRVHHDRKPCELDEAICRALNDLEVPVTELRYLLAIDADTRISTSSISHMVYFMKKNKKCLACCGETKVDNKTASWVTMIQVFEYFASHHLKKAFEGAFGCVTCLPGCFTMYRIFGEDFRPLLSDDKVYQAYRRNDIKSLHEKNLFHLGEDRMLTTLLLKTFYDMQLSFVPWAACWTIVPDTFWVLLSQRRRWINSTFHNMLELLNVKTMCGCCCFSMKTIVILDMVSTLILPASVLYALSFIYIVFWEGEQFTTVTLFLYAIIFGVQFLAFVVRSRLDYIWWFFIYFVLGIPVFYFILPLYSFWRMDDLSWGQTRQVSAEPKPEAR